MEIAPPPLHPVTSGTLRGRADGDDSRTSHLPQDNNHLVLPSSNRKTDIRMSISPGRAILILLLAECLLMIYSCTRQAYPGAPIVNTESQADRKELDEFMDTGVEKPLDTHNVTADEIISTARRYLGVPHCMGGKTMKCIDCSGLLTVVYATHGMQLPHSSEEQARYGKIISEKKNLQKGDMVFFIRTYNSSRFITHSGIYMGDNKFIHTSTSLGVTVTSLNDPWWSERYLFATRVLE